MARQIKYLLFHFLSSQQQQQQLDLIIFHFRLFNKFSSTRRLPKTMYRKEIEKLFFESLSLYNTNIRLCVVPETLTGCWWIHSLQYNQAHSLHLTESLVVVVVIWLFVVKKWNESINLTCTYSENTKNMMMHSLRCVVTNADLFSHKRCNH